MTVGDEQDLVEDHVLDHPQQREAAQVGAQNDDLAGKTGDVVMLHVCAGQPLGPPGEEHTDAGGSL